ncbi:hypothetical protein [Pseudomonas sp. OV226]|uniref:hypothetical protein n=1 Tax=Pseudomonas sp. OV226 TaxID=2135588 RepID=UPI000D6CB129|nr:hypothetical protein [Pseudomonas sp. OV226]PWK44814.1 hypothetical protein C7534_102373 [Pseudomonas sp. OV226]
MNLHVAKGDAELMMDAGIFMRTIASLVSDDLCEQGCDGKPFLSAYKLEGLMKGLQFAAHSLEERSEWLSGAMEKHEAAEEEMTKAALERRQGRDDHRESNVRTECGTQRAA